MKNTTKSQVWRRILLIGAVGLVTGCGGGGGGGENGGGASQESSNAPSIPAAPTVATEVYSGISIQLTSSPEMSETAYVGGDIPRLVVQGNYKLTPGAAVPGGTLYTRVIGMDPRMYLPANVNLRIEQLMGGGTAELTMEGVMDHVLPQGKYNSNLSVEVCIDPECTVQLAGSPLKVNYTLDVQPSFELLPTNVLNLRGVAGVQGTPVEIALNVPADTKDTFFVAGPLDTGPAPISFGYFSDPKTFAFDNTKFTVTPGAAAAGTYQARYRISWKGVKSILTVNYTVTP